MAFLFFAVVSKDTQVKEVNYSDEGISGDYLMEKITTTAPSHRCKKIYQVIQECLCFSSLN